MSRAAEVELAFAGEDRMFRLPLGRLRALQEKCDAGPMELLGRYVQGNWRVDDVREAILQGLIGGGMESGPATKLVQTNFDDLPIQQFIPLAQAVVMASVIGIGDEPPGEPEAGADQTKPSPAASSVSPRSTGRARPSGTRRAKSTISPSGSSQQP